MARMCVSLKLFLEDEPLWPEVPKATLSDGLPASGCLAK
jgi:hypothetical protein